MEKGVEFVGKGLLLERGGERVLAVGDLHLGYEETLNRAGIFVSREMFNEMIADFERIFEKTGRVDKIVLLGDVKHIFGEISRQEWNDVLQLITYLSAKSGEIIIVKGNHDKLLAPILKNSGIELRESYSWREFCFVHGNKDLKEIWDKSIEYVVAGHIHPAVKLREGAKVERFKCFLMGEFKGKKLIIVPSFIEHNVGSDPGESEEMLAWDVNLGKFEVFVVPVEAGKLEALDFGKLREIKD